MGPLTILGPLDLACPAIAEMVKFRILGPGGQFQTAPPPPPKERHWDHDVLLRCFNSFTLPCLEYCSRVWSSAADSHLKLLDKNLRACKFLIPNLTISLQHRRLLAHCVCFARSFITLLILSILNFSTCSVSGFTRGSWSMNSLSFSPI